MANTWHNIDDYIAKYINAYELLTKGDAASSVKVDFGSRVEGRTRNNDITEALRLRVHDPLWMLARQWQMGEFRGNDTGTAMSVRCSIKEEDCSTDPIEPVTEQINPDIDIMARVEAATFALDLVRNSAGSAKAKEFKKTCIEKYPLKWDELDNNQTLGSEITSDFENSLNSHLADYRKAYEGKIFDGYEFYKEVSKETEQENFGEVEISKFVNWFRSKYLPASKDNDHWQDEDLCYKTDAYAGGKHFVGDNYQGGRLSWYTFDYEKEKNSQTTSTVKTVKRTKIRLLRPASIKPADSVTDERKSQIAEIVESVEKDGKTQITEIVESVGRYASEKATHSREVLSLPTPASFASAPSRRLWQMEDRKVYMGNSLEKQSEGNVVTMKYATMYSNDWMLFPLQTKIGQYITVDKIEIIDTFGGKHVISGENRAGRKDKLGTREEAWQMFTNTNVNDRRTSDVQGLYFVPQLAATIEGKPIEEVKILRDEMANMVWGVEEVVPDGCGDTINANSHAIQLAIKVSEINEEGLPKRNPQTVQFAAGTDPQTISKNNVATYRYLLQSTVPYNWIPFIPQRLKDGSSSENPFFQGGREMILRRGKMPCYLYENNKFSILPVRPLGSILRPEIDGDKESPMVIHEEAVQATGIRLTKNYQRARWLNGKVYNWLGLYKRQSSTKSSSSLTFDELQLNE